MENGIAIVLARYLEKEEHKLPPPRYVLLNVIILVTHKRICRYRYKHDEKKKTDTDGLLS